VGCGRIAERHAEHIANFGLLQAVCDVKADRANALAQKYHSKSYLAIEELIENEPSVEVVSICTPNGLHAQHAVKALKKGFHALVEKPMALTVRDCEAMIHEAEKANRRIFVIKQNRFNPPVAALKSVIDENRLGRILNVQLNCFWNRNENYYLNSDWKGTKKLDGGTLFTQYSHFIDLLYWLAGDVDEVQAFTGNLNHEHQIEFEDTGVIILRFLNGALGTINYTVNSHQRNMEGSITVFGENGTVKVGGQYLNVLEYQDIKNYTIEVAEDSRPANDYGFYQGSMSNHDKVYENVVNVLRNNDVIVTNALDGLKTVQIIEKIYEAAIKNTRMSYTASTAVSFR
jgi:predicted dehydrogenase